MIFRLIFLLMVFLAGFVTAIYFLTPLPEKYNGTVCKSGNAAGAAVSPSKQQHRAVMEFNGIMHKFVAMVKSAAVNSGEYIKETYDEYQNQGKKPAQ